MCIEFDGHHSGGSSFDLYMIFLIILSVGHTHRYQFSSVFKKKKKKNQVKSPNPESRVPETGSDPPIGSGRGSGRDKQIHIRVLGKLTCFVGVYIGAQRPHNQKYEEVDSRHLGQLPHKSKLEEVFENLVS